MNWLLAESIETWWLKSVVDNGPWAVAVFLIAFWIARKFDDLIGWHKDSFDKLVESHAKLSQSHTSMDLTIHDLTKTVDHELKPKIDEIHAKITHRR